MPPATQHLRSVESAADSRAEPVMIAESAFLFRGLERSREIRADVFVPVTGLATRNAA